jgi:hypothetical protein
VPITDVAQDLSACTTLPSLMTIFGCAFWWNSAALSCSFSFLLRSLHECLDFEAKKKSRNLELFQHSHTRPMYDASNTHTGTHARTHTHIHTHALSRECEVADTA